MTAKTEEDKQKIITSIFDSSEKGKASLIPLMISTKEIPSLIKFLKENNHSLEDKMSLLSSLMGLFKINNILIPPFLKKCIVDSTIYYFLEPLIDLYLNQNLKKEDESLLESLFKIILENVSLTKVTLEYIYQKLSKYFIKENKEILKENLLLQILKLLKIFYTDQLVHLSEKEKEIKNYMYFNGKDSGLSLTLNKSSINLNTDFPTLENGCSFVFWFYVNKELMTEYYAKNPKQKFILVHICIGTHHISLELNGNDSIKFVVDENESSLISIKSMLKFNDWNNICFVLNPKSGYKLPFDVYINNKSNSAFLSISTKFEVSDKINSIKFFENFLGKVTSVFFFSFVLNQKQIEYFAKLPHGFQKNKQLLKFLISNDKEYLLNGANQLKYYNQIKVDKSLELFNFSLKKQNIKNLICFLCPFIYNKEENTTDDIFGNFIGNFGPNDGINMYRNNTKSIRNLGGMNNLLPIIELMYSTISKAINIKYDYVDKSILTENTLYEYLNVLKQILLGHEKNLSDANNRKFFSCLGLFLEKFPPNLFTDRILDIFLEIGKEAFQMTDSKIVSCNDNFVNMILLNEKIFSKFSKENQLKLWETVHKFFTSDNSHMKDYFNMSKICLLLRFYDENRYNEYCCTKHANLFKPIDTDKTQKEKYNPKIMNPEMNNKIEKLFIIIELYMEQLSGEEEEVVNLYKFLSLDLSPCLQKKIIQTYYYLFQNTKSSSIIKSNTIENLLKNNFIEITEYVLTISLLDVRIEILKLLKYILENKELYQIFKNYLKNMRGDNGVHNFHHFIADNLLPDKLFAEIEIDKEKKDNQNNSEVLNVFDERKRTNTNFGFVNFKSKNTQLKVEKHSLVKYFNTEIYDENLQNLWELLSQWLTTKSSSKKSGNVAPNSNININEYALNYCLLYVSRAPARFVDLFIMSILSFFNDETIVNRKILYENKNIFPWLIETIFYYHNKENESEIKDISNVDSIRKNSILFFKEFFKNNLPSDEFVKKVNYVFKYSYYLKKMYENEPKKKDEISKTTRLLFEQVILCKPKRINEVIKLLLEYILLYEHSENLGENRNNIGAELNKISANSYGSPSDTEEKKEENKNEKDELLPKFIYENLHYESQIIKDEKMRTLNYIWKDFSIYVAIIDFYKSNLWGIENLCKKVKIEYNGDPLRLCKNLLKEYGDTKSYRNILKEDIIKYLNIKIVELKDSKENFKIVDDDLVNIFDINLLLLCVAIDITQDEEERNYIEGLYQQFLIYCVMVSLNINQTEKCHDYIQDNINTALGFGALYLHKKDKKKYNEIKDQLLLPIFEEIYAEQTKKGLGKLFSSKKNLFSSTSVCKLFQYGDNVDEIESEMERKNDQMKKTLGIDNVSISTPSADKKGRKSVTEKSNNKNYIVSFKGDILTILKNIFETYLLNYKVEKKQEFTTEIFYKNAYKGIGIYDKQNNEEKKTINKKINKLIPFFESQIKKYSNTSFLEEKKRRNDYKWSKKRLFSWRGFWSDKELFYKHPEHLKLKLKNHYTKEMTLPLLSPILDVEYYLPDFGKFNKKNLFNAGDYSYRISLDIDDILRDETDEIIENINKTGDIINKYTDLDFVRNVYDFNYLECLYKLTYDDLWEKYKSFFVQQFNFDKIILQNKEAFEMLLESKEISKNEEIMRIENIYNCCIVKPTHHILGYISTEQNRIKFIYDSESRKNTTNETLENDPTYDRDMDCCFGSVFKTYKKDKDKINFIIDYANIKYMFMRYYFYIQSGLEIYTKTNKVYFLNFKTNKDLLSFTNDILNHSTDNYSFREIKTEDYKGKKLLGYESVFNPELKIKPYMISSKMEEWQTRNISTLEYLMYLNIYAGRSFNDLTQYPVFPWIITNYDKDELSPKKDYRNLCLPMGMLDLSEKGEARKETFKETYDSIKNDLKEMFPDFNYKDFLNKNDEYYENYRNKKKKKDKKNNPDEMKLDVNHLPYFYGSHYSNPTYISHYLTRTFPYSFVAIEIQGEKFDDPDRLFLSMNKTFISASSLKDDVRELIPEFFTTPEIFLNRNNLNLSQDKKGSDNQTLIINDVDLPKWCKNNAFIFVAEMRRQLETGDLKINKWIDLIFGSYQRGEKAEENNNIFKAQSYERMVKIDDITDPDSRNALMRLIEIGVTPLQIFASDTKQKYDKKQFLDKNPIYSSSSKGIFIYESKKLYSRTIKSPNLANIKTKLYENNKNSNNKDYNPKNLLLEFPKVACIKYISHQNIRIFTNTNQWFNIKYSPSEKEYGVDESNIFSIDNNSNKYAISYRMNNIKIPMVIYENCKFLVKGGFWDGRLEFNTITTEPKEEPISTNIFNNNGGAITIIEMTEAEKYLLCGTKEGFLILYRIKKKKLEQQHNLFLHSDQIISISINDTLNMFATSSKDGYVMINTLPTLTLVRSIHIPSQFKNENQLLYADNVFLSNSPVPCITLYISSKKLFRTYSINGELIGDVSESDDSKLITSYYVFSDYEFQDYLIYGTNNGFVKIRKFPEMDLINSINPFNDGKQIETICLSPDKKYCFAWSSSNLIAVISDPSASGVKSAENMK